jgi:hypothetical protein
MLLLKEDLTTIAAFVMSLYLFPPENPCLDPLKPVEVILQRGLVMWIFPEV